MSQMFKQSVGIDMSKDKFADAARMFVFQSLIFSKRSPLKPRVSSVTAKLDSKHLMNGSTKKPTKNRSVGQ